VRAVVVNPNVLVANGGRRQRPAGRGLPAPPMMVDNSGRLKYNPEMSSGINRTLRTKTAGAFPLASKAWLIMFI